MVHRAPGCCPPPWSPSQGDPVWVQLALSSSLLQCWQQALFCQVSLQGVEDVELLINTEGQELLDHLAGVGAPDEASNVYINESGHEVLAVKSVHNATVTWDGVGKILDLEGSLEAAGKEATKGSHNGGERGQSDAVDLEWVETHCGPSGGRLQDTGKGIVLELEKVRRLTVHLETVGVIVKLHRTHKVAAASHHIGEHDAKHNGGEESTDETLPCLFRRQLDERGAAEEKAKHVGHNVITDHTGNWHNEPDHPFKQVVNDKVRLSHHNQQCDMGPTKHIKLKAVMFLNQTQHKHAETCEVEGKGDKTVVFAEDAKWLLSLYQCEEVICHCLSIEEVIHTQQEVPAQRPEPGQVVGVVHTVANGDDFMEALDLNTQDNHHKHHGAQVDDEEEEGDHG